MKRFWYVLALFLALTGSFWSARAGENTDALAESFYAPPDSAKPWAYWWWLNGNVSKEGITRDLEEMKRQGINGVLIFQAGGGTTPPGVQFLSPQWHELFQYALREASRLGMGVSINLCDGWCSGGPWITPELAHKKLVYSEVQVEGQQKLSQILPLPPVVGDFYREVAVVAVRERLNRPLTPIAVTASSTLRDYLGEWNSTPPDAADGDPQTFWTSANTAPSPSQPNWLAFEYREPIAATGIYVLPGPQNGPRNCELQASDDGKAFSTVSRFSMENGKGRRVEFPEVRAGNFRLLIVSAYGVPVKVAEAVVLRKGDEPNVHPGIKWWRIKSGNRGIWNYPREGPVALGEEYSDDGTFDCKSSEAEDLTQSMAADGRIQWDVPQGRWTIFRFGYTLGGQRTGPKTGGGRGGYEAGMLDSAPIECHFKNTAEPMLADALSTGTKALKYLHIDSFEVSGGSQLPTWSRTFREEFKQRRGYDLLPYLPALAMRIVDSREITDRFLADFRWTIGDLMDERFWARFGELAHGHGVSIHSENGYGTWPFPHIDGLRCAGNDDIPMGEFWFGSDIMSQFDPWGNAIKTMANAAHIYGRPLVQAESFTAWTHFKEYPQALKPVGDQAFLDGLNRMVLSQYTHQPLLDMKPGLQFYAGTHFDRNITWWEQARAFFQYLARCQYLLQQGTFVADTLYFYGEGVTKFVPSKQYLHPALPQGYDFDAINAEVLMRGLSVDDGRLVLPSGMSYRVLVMPEDGVVSAEVLRKIRDLVVAGAVVSGPKPARAPGLKGYPASQDELKKLADEVWGDCDGREVKERQLGRGRIVWGKPLGEVLAEEGVAPDFEYRGKGEDASLGFIHYTVSNTEIYFLSNRHEQDESAECIFRVSGKRPELWDPVSGATRPVTAFRQSGGRTSVPLEFAPYGSWFVVFRQPIGKEVNGTASSNFPVYANAQELSGPWTVSFDEKWGGPAQAAFTKLVSWTERPEEGIKYYSGTATYRKSFDLGEALRGGQERIALDLGDVRDVAQVRLNGKDLGPVWTKPFRVDITEAVKPTGNVLEVEVVNLWVNRILGDASLPPEKRYTHTNITYKKGEPLVESGLLGPVRLMSTNNREMGSPVPR
jgi:hypothetical protein